MRSIGTVLQRRRQDADHEGKRADGLRQDDAGDGIGEADAEKDETDADPDDQAGNDQRRQDEHLDGALGPERDLGEREGGRQRQHGRERHDDGRDRTGS